jgi:hypothetical protein
MNRSNIVSGLNTGGPSNNRCVRGEYCLHDSYHVERLKVRITPATAADEDVLVGIATEGSNDNGWSYIVALIN